MKLKESYHTEFELTVTGYEFPNLKDEPYDADWLKIRVKLKHPLGIWSKTYPCLLTWELADLVKWFKTIADKNPPHSNIGFMEPELSFYWTGKAKNVLRIYLDYSLRPPWSPYYGSKAEDEFFVEFTMCSEDLRKSADSLESERMRFPIRVGYNDQPKGM